MRRPSALSSISQRFEPPCNQKGTATLPFPAATQCASRASNPIPVKHLIAAPTRRAAGVRFLRYGTSVQPSTFRGVTVTSTAITRARALKVRATPPSPFAGLDDARVVQTFLDGDARAFTELVVRYQSRLLNFVYRTIGDRERAEDLVQEVFVRVYRHLARFDQSKKFSTWIYTIASNLAKNELRNRSRNPLVLFQTIRKNWDADHRPLQFEDTKARPDDLYRKRFLKGAVGDCVAKLPEHARAGFAVREIDGRSYQEIAEITGCNLGTVKSRLNRARNSFAELISPLLE